MKRYPYDAKALSVGAGQQILQVPGGGNHWTRAIVFDRAGQKMYVSVGSSSNITPDEERRAAINRYNPDGSGHEIFASGTRNPSSIHWYPNTDTLWVTVIERDGLGDDLPPDYFTHVQPGRLLRMAVGLLRPARGAASQRPAPGTGAEDDHTRRRAARRTTRRSTSPSTRARSFLPSIAAARSSRCTARGTVRSAPDTRWCTCRSRTASRQGRRRIF